jgi:hypothetical protein
MNDKNQGEVQKPEVQIPKIIAAGLQVQFTEKTGETWLARKEGKRVLVVKLITRCGFYIEEKGKRFLGDRLGSPSIQQPTDGLVLVLCDGDKIIHAFHVYHIAVSTV